MANGIRTSNPRGVNKRRSSKFRVDSRARQTTKKAGGYIGRNFVEITIKMKTIVQKPLIIKRFFFCKTFGFNHYRSSFKLFVRIDGAVTGTKILSHSETGNNGNVKVDHTDPIY